MMSTIIKGSFEKSTHARVWMAHGISDYGTWPPADASNSFFSGLAVPLHWQRVDPGQRVLRRVFPGPLLEKPLSSWALKKMWTEMAGQGWK